ncbi:MAG: alpha/beta hydrolase [Gammaproteobacteria bacterium]|nr:alpha/beta hydrolase [Gammaproteobacteria bacterium]
MLMMNGKQGFRYRTGQSGTLEHFKGARLVDIDDAGHWVHHDQFDEVIAQLREFLTTSS